MKKILLILILTISFCGCSETEKVDISGGQISETTTNAVDQDIMPTNTIDQDITPTNTVDQDKTPTNAVDQDNTGESLSDKELNIIEPDGLNESFTNMTKLAEICKELKNNNIFAIDSVKDKEKFKEIWSLIYTEWYKSEWIQEANEKKVISDSDGYYIVETFPSDENDGGENTGSYYIQECNWVDGYGYWITSFELKKQDSYLYIYGWEADAEDKSETHLCYILDMENSLIWSPDLGNTYGYIGTDISDYMNEKMLVGTYKDQNGKDYVFGADKTACWDGKKFKYKISDTALSGAGCNLISVVDDHNEWTGAVYGYRIEDDKLCIYNVELVDIEYFLVSDEPIAVLSKY